MIPTQIEWIDSKQDDIYSYLVVTIDNKECIIPFKKKDINKIEVDQLIEERCINDNKEK